MSKRVKIIDNSGIRFQKKKNPGQTELSAFGYNALNGEYYSIPINIETKPSQITIANISTQVDALTIVTNNVIPSWSSTQFYGTLISDGGLTITEMGAVWDTNPFPDISKNVVDATPGVGSFNVNLTSLPYAQNVYVRAFAMASGLTTSGETILETVYGGQITFELVPCLIEGTLITLFDGSHKKIEDVTYSDELLVWNFDEGKFDKSKPFWIAKPSTAQQYSLTKFSDGSEIKSILPHLGHRILNIEKGTFTYPMTEDTIIGTHTFNDKGEQTELISKEIVNEEAHFYNIITDKQINMFANGILTSCRLNNLYPISDMKFVKDNRELRTKDDYGIISNDTFNGIRLAEQNMSIDDLKIYMTQRNMK